MLVRKFTTKQDALDFIRENEAAIRREYIKKDLTARLTAERFNVQHNQFWTKALHDIMPKGKGWGGTRQGAGNKKGIQFCGNCRKTVDNCIC